MFTECSQEKYGIAEDKLRIFVHYQPTYYHFHVHFVHTSYMGGGTACGQAILLDDVIGECFCECFCECSVNVP
jgi:m7GpppX diphosphatase